MKNKKLQTCLISGILLLLFLNLSLTLKAQRNCSEIHYSNPSAPSGVYVIDPDGGGPLPQMNCNCDMTTDGGGWTLVLNYNHLSDSHPALKIRTDSLPLLNHTTLGFDESNTIYWGHADTNLMNNIPFDEVRFYGITSDHNRVINFKSSHAGTISYFKTGIGSTLGISTNFTPLTDHTAFLPAAIDMTAYDKGNYAMTEYPLWKGSTYHWFLAGYDAYCASIRWEVDNYPCSTEPSTIHQIWVRQNYALGINNSQSSAVNVNVTPNPTADIATITVNCNPEQFKNIQLQIYDMVGKQLFIDITRNATSFSIQKGVLLPGVYILKLKNENSLFSTVKLIIQ